MKAEDNTMKEIYKITCAEGNINTEMPKQRQVCVFTEITLILAFKQSNFFYAAGCALPKCAAFWKYHYQVQTGTKTVLKTHRQNTHPAFFIQCCGSQGSTQVPGSGQADSWQNPLVPMWDRRARDTIPHPDPMGHVSHQRRKVCCKAEPSLLKSSAPWNHPCH